MNTSGIVTKLTAVQTGLTTISHPLAIVAIIVCLIIYIMSPLMSEWAREHRNTFVKIAIAALLIGWAPDFITFLMGA